MRAVFDIDDTLLVRGEPLCVLEDFVLESYKLGYELVLATARPLVQLRRQKWSSFVSYIIPYNGICYFDTQAQKCKNVLRLEAFELSYRKLNGVFVSPVEFVACVDEKQVAYLSHSDSERDSTLWSNIAQKDAPSFLTYCGSEKEVRLLAASGWIDSLKNNISLFSYPETRFGTELIWFEVVPRLTSKGLQAAVLPERSPQISIAAGNGWNDLSLLSLAARTLCPSNASEEVKDAVDCVSEREAGKEFRKFLLTELERMRHG